MCKWWILCGLFISLLDCRLSSNVILAANRREIIWFACKRLSLSALPKDWAWSSLSNSTLGGSVCYLPVGTALLCGTKFYSLYCDVLQSSLDVDDMKDATNSKCKWHGKEHKYWHIHTTHSHYQLTTTIHHITTPTYLTYTHYIFII